MSQLPELEVVKRDLDKEVVGKKVKDVWVSPASLVKRHGTIKDFSTSLEGKKLETLDRTGQTLLFGLDSDETFVIIPGTRIRMTRETANADRREYTRMTMTFTTGGSMHYVDVEADGEMFIVPNDQLNEVEELISLGMDPLAEPIPWPLFAQALENRNEKLKVLLTENSFVVGLGDVYSDEVLFEAGIAPDRLSGTLSSQEVRRLHRSILEVVHEAIKQGGINHPGKADDDAFLPYNEIEFLKIFGREGERDARSRGTIIHSEVADGLWSYHSPGTQT